VSAPVLIHLVRHGEAAQRWVEARDPALSERGRAQAEDAAMRLAASPPMALRTSPLRRAQETAAPLATRWQIPPLIDEAFREVPGPDDFAARPAWIADLMQAEWSQVDAAVTIWRTRLWDALLALEEDTVIHTHFMVINAAVSILKQAPRVVVFEPDHCSVTVLARRGQQISLHELGASRTTQVL
jgi:broad specificity phosphatase PhoE